MTNIQLSKRLSAACEMVPQGSRVVDVGTDHGFVPIYLMEKHKAAHVIAMDVNEGPLQRATDHVREYGFENDIELRLSDGLLELKDNEADTMVCAGMGGLLMLRILDEGRPVRKGITTMILQPQSDLYSFRKYLREQGFFIADEREIFEEGKYYTAMKVVVSCDNDPYIQVCEKFGEKNGTDADRMINMCHRFGPVLILKRDVVLKEYLQRELELCERILLKLSENAHTERMRDIMNKKNDISFLLSLY